MWKKICAFELATGLAELPFVVIVAAGADAGVDAGAGAGADAGAVMIVVGPVAVHVVEKEEEEVSWVGRSPGETTCGSPMSRYRNLWVGDKLRELVYFHLEARVIYHTEKIFGAAG